VNRPSGRSHTPVHGRTSEYLSERTDQDFTRFAGRDWAMVGSRCGSYGDGLHGDGLYGDGLAHEATARTAVQYRVRCMASARQAIGLQFETEEFAAAIACASSQLSIVLANSAFASYFLWCRGSLGFGRFRFGLGRFERQADSLCVAIH
jgi:hypothetical protein